MYKIKNIKTGLYQRGGSEWIFESDWNGGGKIWVSAGACKNHLAYLANEFDAYPNWKGEYTEDQKTNKEKLLEISKDWEIVCVNFETGERTTWEVLEFYPNWLDR